MVDQYGIDWDEVKDIMRPYEEKDDESLQSMQENAQVPIWHGAKLAPAM